MAGELAPRTAYVLPDAMRRELAVPFGPVLSTRQLAEALKDHAGPVVAVGDHVSLTLKELGVAPRLFVCDYHTQRGQDEAKYRAALAEWGDREVRVQNPAAQITREAWMAVAEAMRRVEGTTRIVVEGEEDLLGIPCFLEAPVGAVVLYGMPGQGVVVVEVGERIQATVAALLCRMDSA